MLKKHQGLGITDKQRFRFASLMSLAADDAGMPSDPEFRSALVAYLEWGTRLAIGELAARRSSDRACARASVGLGRSAAVPAMIAADSVVPAGYRASWLGRSTCLGPRRTGCGNLMTGIEPQLWVEGARARGRT